METPATKSPALLTAEVGVEDGLKAAVMAMAAQQSALPGQAMRIAEDGYNFEARREELPAYAIVEKREKTCRS